MKLVVRNDVQKNLFNIELSGQISDGMWENASPNGHWREWCNCEVEVGNNVGIDFYPKKNNYLFNSKQLLECVGDRMLKICQMTIAGFNEDEIKIAYDYDLDYLEKLASGNSSTDYWKSQLEKYKSIPQEKFEILKEVDFTMKDMIKQLQDLRKIIKISRVG